MGLTQRKVINLCSTGFQARYNDKENIKVKVTPWYAYAVAEGRWNYSSLPFKTSTLEGGGWSAPHPVALPAENPRYPLYRRHGGRHGKFHPPPGFDFRTVQLLAILATDKRNIPLQNSVCPLRTQSEYSYCGVSYCARTVVCGACISFPEDCVAFTFRVKCRRRKYFLRNTGTLGHILCSTFRIKTLRKSKCFIAN